MLKFDVYVCLCLNIEVDIALFMVDLNCLGVFMMLHFFLI